MPIKYYPATIVSSIAALQAVFVLVIEQLFLKKIGGITKDGALKPKLGGILLIVSGVIIMTIVGMV